MPAMNHLINADEPTKPQTTRPPKNTDEPWSPKKSAALYQIEGWGRPYFRVGDDGHVIIRPNPDEQPEVDLFNLICSLKERGLAIPVLLRFADILRHRICRLNEAFGDAIREYKYRGRYQGVFPVKVNQ